MSNVEAIARSLERLNEILIEKQNSDALVRAGSHVSGAANAIRHHREHVKEAVRDIFMFSMCDVSRQPGEYSGLPADHLVSMLEKDTPEWQSNSKRENDLKLITATAQLYDHRGLSLLAWLESRFAFDRWS